VGCRRLRTGVLDVEADADSRTIIEMEITGNRLRVLSGRSVLRSVTFQRRKVL